MEHIEIGNSGLRASRIALGTWSIGGWMWGGTEESDARRTLHEALDRGITLIDTAPIYGFGRSEEIVGRALAESGRRDEVLLATKAGLEWHEDGVDRNSSPVRLEREIEDSLRRLATDRIDLYQIHWPDRRTPFEETAAALDRLLRAGKIRSVGVSNYSPAQIEAFRRGGPLHAVQPPYNLFERGVEKAVLPYAAEHGLTVLAYGSLCRGLLSGKITEETTWEGDDLRNTDPKLQPPRRGQYLAAVRALERFARESYGKSVLALAVRWILDRGNTIALWGARRPGQLDAVGEVLGWSLDEAALGEIDRILTEHIQDPVGPEFMAPPE
jgi:aryl-alcohol dehydrogenase-like predicted oxidoreductase